MIEKPSFHDFFAGSGLVTEAMKSYFRPAWANDICEKKAAVYRSNHPADRFQRSPIEDVKGKSLPYALLSWSSFPCQDLSLAGNIGGISSPRSGLVWHWLRVMDEMSQRPKLLVAENVVGLISARKGKHYQQLHSALSERGYRVGAIIIDAAYWVPQSRKRVFVIAIDKELDTSAYEAHNPIWCHPRNIIETAKTVDDWVWWKLKAPNGYRKELSEIIEFNSPYDDHKKTNKNIRLISPKHRERLDDEVAKGTVVFPGYKRVRNGHQVLELRFDGIAGCLRTPQGGSSRQLLVIKHKGRLKTRLLTIKEAAALMGVRKTYKIPGSYNDGYKAMGDAVAVPVARHLARYLLRPLAQLALK